MKCPSCGAEFDLHSVKVLEDHVNSFGRREFVLQAEGQGWIKWEDGFYHCLKCSHKFSFQEGTLQ